MATSSSKVTTDHDTIRKWAEKRNGIPASVAGTARKKEDAGLLRIEFLDQPALDEVDWDAFFEKFDEKGLAFLYQEKTKDGKESRFHKFVDRDSVEEKLD